jgi:hypothetical protein
VAVSVYARVLLSGSMTCIMEGACHSSRSMHATCMYSGLWLWRCTSQGTCTQTLCCPCLQVGVNVWQARRHIRDVHQAWAHRLPEAPHFPSKARRGRLLAALLRALLALLLLVLLSAMLLAALSPASLQHVLAADGQLADGAAAVKEVVVAVGEQVQEVAVGWLGAVAQGASRLAQMLQSLQLANGHQEL